MAKALYTLNQDQANVLAKIVEEGPLPLSSLRGKTECRELITRHWAAEIVVKTESGYIAATYEGMRLYCAYFDGNTVERAMLNRQSGNYLPGIAPP